jgi:hypothetical protein
LTEQFAARADDPWDRPYEVVRRELVGRVIGSEEPTCGVAPELLRPIA